VSGAPRKSTPQRRGRAGRHALQGKTERHQTQRSEILDLLKARGSAGATNTELNEIGFRYGARLWELKKEGYRIRTECLGDGLYNFTLLSEPISGSPLPSRQLPSKPETTLPLFAGARE